MNLCAHIKLNQIGHDEISDSYFKHTIQRLQLMFWQPPVQLQSSVHERLLLKHLQRALEQPFLHPHFSNS